MSTFIHEMFSEVLQFCFSFIIIIKQLYFIKCKKERKNNLVIAL